MEFAVRVLYRSLNDYIPFITPGLIKISSKLNRNEKNSTTTNNAVATNTSTTANTVRKLILRSLFWLVQNILDAF